MAAPINNVLIIGNHLLSATIIHALTHSPNHDYTLTILTSPHQTPLLPSSHPLLHHHHTPHPHPSTSTPRPITHHTTDFSSLPSLTTSFRNQDVVVNTISGSHALQTLIIDAALAAGVPRFIPAEFGLDSLDAGIQAALPPARARARVVDYLREKECQRPARSFEWVAIATGTPLDTKLLDGSLGFDFAWRSASVPGPGTQQVACSSIAHVGRVVAEVLRRWDEEGVRNTYIYAAEFVTSAKEVVGSLEKAMGREWSVGVVEGGEWRREAEERLRGGWMEKGWGLLERWAVFEGGLGGFGGVGLRLEGERERGDVGRVVEGAARAWKEGEGSGGVECGCE